MKLQILSDLHIEFKHLTVPKTDADYLILAGDIHVGIKAAEWALDLAEDHEKEVLFVPGNHEYYGHDMVKLYDDFLEFCEGTPVRFLHGGTLFVDDIRILGCTLWTDFKRAGEQFFTMSHAKNINDFRLIQCNGKPFTVDDWIAMNEMDVLWLDNHLQEPFKGKTVVITHHAPTDKTDSVHAHGYMSNYFWSDYEDMMGPHLDLWIHGHTHANGQVVINGTRVVTNQRGYPYEDLNFDPGFCVTV